MKKIEENDFPGLYQVADKSSGNAQKKYFLAIGVYLILLIAVALCSYCDHMINEPRLKILSALLFITSLAIVIWLKVSKPYDIWYNGRAVAESVKTRTWRWMMKTEPYEVEGLEVARKHFINDLQTILTQNKSLVGEIGINASLADPVNDLMVQVRSLSLSDRFEYYRSYRITDQAIWYSKKAKFNKDKSSLWFWVSVSLHSLAVVLLLYNIQYPDMEIPIDVIAVGASSVITWLQSKKHNELASSYSLTAHEIVLLKGEIITIENDSDLSSFVINCENAFSREHTQWFARKIE